mmetsp:Transcript_22708/g.40457  ORF Transcript_22708/g.40457 Transcript_22708/m.40457 type:complete len:212 (-) Transcript_22708:41-676(-)
MQQQAATRALGEESKQRHVHRRQPSGNDVHSHTSTLRSRGHSLDVPLRLRLRVLVLRVVLPVYNLRRDCAWSHGNGTTDDGQDAAHATVARPAHPATIVPRRVRTHLVLHQRQCHFHTHPKTARPVAHGHAFLCAGAQALHHRLRSGKAAAQRRNVSVRTQQQLLHVSLLQRVPPYDHIAHSHAPRLPQVVHSHAGPECDEAHGCGSRQRV